MDRLAASGRILAAIAALGFVVLQSRAAAQDASPVSGVAGHVTAFAVVEQNEYVVDIDQGDTGPSAGDLRVWGPNPLVDAANGAEVGAMTSGTCVALNAEFECLASETLAFSDGSTLVIQGVQLPAPQPSVRTIVGGSGEYLGATGTMRVVPTDDEAKWTKTLEIVIPAKP